MRIAFLLLVLTIVSSLPPASVLAQTDAQEEDMRIELRYLEDRLFEIGTGSGSLLSSSDYESLLLEADRVFTKFPDSASVYAMRGIIKYSYQLEMDDVGKLPIAESAKNDLETAIALGGNDIGGEPYMYLGNLYLNTPPWPAGFGDETRAGELLWRSQALNPDDFDANYFLGLYLIKIGAIDDARTYLGIALRAPVSPRREAGISARRARIATILEDL